MVSNDHPKYPNHHRERPVLNAFRDIVFGMEDGMVSTFGVITGIALAARDHQTVLLAGVVVIAVESLSMGVGSFISNKAERDIARRKLAEEKIEHAEFPQQEKEELASFYIKAGWPKTFAQKMVDIAYKNKELFFREMAYHELGIVAQKKMNPVRNGVFMFLAYVFGGLIPLLAYFFLPISQAVVLSIILSLLSLFILGVVIGHFTKRKWWKSGLELLLLAGLSGTIGYLAGQIFNN